MGQVGGSKGKLVPYFEVTVNGTTASLCPSALSRLLLDCVRVVSSTTAMNMSSSVNIAVGSRLCRPRHSLPARQGRRDCARAYQGARNPRPITSQRRVRVEAVTLERAASTAAAKAQELIADVLPTAPGTNREEAVLLQGGSEAILSVSVPVNTDSLQGHATACLGRYRRLCFSY